MKVLSIWLVEGIIWRCWSLG